MKHIPPSPPYTPVFHWRLSVDLARQVLVEFTHDLEMERWFCAGPISNPDGPLRWVWDKAFEPNPFRWRTLPSTNTLENTATESEPPDAPKASPKKVRSHDSDSLLERIRAEDEKRELYLLGLVGEATGLKLDAQKWRMLSPNAVLHPRYGPAVTIATDGVRVILFSFAQFGSDYYLTHRTTIHGPVTSTAVRSNEWNYVANKPLNPDGTAKRTRKPAGKSVVEQTRELLKMLQTLTPVEPMQEPDGWTMQTTNEPI